MDMDDVTVLIKGTEGNIVKLVQLVADEDHKMLGVWLTLDGNNLKQVAEMRATTNKWAEKLRT